MPSNSRAESVSLAETEHFYANLPVLRTLDAVMRTQSYVPLPDDWHVALCDVRNSTAAIQRGQYKQVNSLGVAAITAVLNAAGPLEIPFSFEGDGCVVCVPSRLLGAARGALARTRQIARESMGLDLRAALVPVRRLRESGHAVLVARYGVSEHYVQAMFAGGGMAEADRLVKDETTAPGLIVGEDVAPMASLKGFECRWEDIPSRYGETVSLMVRVLERDPSRTVEMYRELFEKVMEIYGDDDRSHPLAVPALKLSLDARRLAVEAAVRTRRPQRLARWLWVQGARVAVLVGRIAMRVGLRTPGTDWGQYKAQLVRNADVRKFIDVYRQILAGTAAQREALTAWLDAQYAAGRLVYGLHRSDRAQMTCVVFDYAGRHLHFVDGADGGLFLAAKAFKERMARLRERAAPISPAA